MTVYLPLIGGISINPVAVTEEKASILEEMDELIRQYDAKPLEREKIATSARQLIERFNKLVEENVEQNLSLARERLCRLLNLTIEEVQLEALSSLQSLLHLNYLDYDIQNNSFNSLLVLEKQISQALDASLRLTDSSKIIPALLESYHSILERLWVLPYLIENTHDAIIPLQENNPSIINQSSTWMALLKMEPTHDTRLDPLLEKIQEMFQKIESASSLNILHIKREVCSYISNRYDNLKEYQKVVVYSQKLINFAKKIGDNVDIWRAYANLGNAYVRLGNWRKVIEFYEKGLQIKKELKDKAGVGIAYGNLALAYHSLEEYRKAIEYHEKDLQIKEELEDKAGIGRAYGNLGNIYRSLGECLKAIEYHEKHLAIAKEIKDKAGEGTIYNTIGNIYYSLKEYQKASKYYKKTLQIAKELEDRNGEGMAYNNLGSAYYFLKHYQKSIEYYEKYLLIVLGLGNLLKQKQAYKMLSLVFFAFADYSKAIDCYENVLKLSLDTRDQREEGLAYKKLGNLYEDSGEYRKAIEYHEKALKISIELEDREGEGVAYGNLGNSHESLADYRKAIGYYEKALKIFIELKDREGEGVAYGNLGNSHESLADYRKAIGYHEKALKIFIELKDKEQEGLTYGNLGTVYLSLAEYRKAIEFHEKALQISIELEDKKGEAKGYGNLGNAYLMLGEPYKAIEYHQKKLPILQKLKDQPGERIVYSNLGNAYDALRDYDKAIEYHEKSLKISLLLGDQGTEGKTYGNLGKVYESIGEYRKAIDYHKKDLQIAKNLGDWSEEALAYGGFRDAYCGLGEYQKAEEFNIESIDIYSKIQNELGDNFQWKISIFEKQFKAYIGLEYLFFNQNKLKQALEIAEARRARALLSSISSKFSKVKDLASLSSLTSVQIQQLAQKLQTTFVVYSLLTEEDSIDKKYRMTAWLIPAQGEISSYQLRWDQNLSHLPFTYLSQQLNNLVKEVENLSSIKRGGSDELDFDLNDLDLEAKAELALLLNNDPEVEKLAATKQADKNKKDQIALKRLKEEKLRPWYDLLIAPLESALPAHGSSITIIPDGVLSQFPFGAFCDKQGTYLIEKYAISLAPSIKTLQLLHQLPQDYPSMSLVVGSPDTGNPQHQLEVADREAKTVNSLLHGSQLLSQKEASISNVSQQMQEARFIHLACHGLAEKKYDKHSVFEGLFKLAPDENDPEPKPEHGYLYAQQIAALNLKAELVFLSACYSGKGNVKQEGSIGPVWSFLGAGAKSTVATYWPLPDSATTFEMVESFYQGILNTDRASLNKAQVLRQVTLKAMEKNRDDFIQWGAFFLSGVSIDAKLD